MSKINSGILGPYSGKLSNVVGYRRNGKNIIQSQRKFTSPTIISNLITNQQKIKFLDIQWTNFQRGINRWLTTIGQQNTFTQEKFMRTNQKRNIILNPYGFQDIILGEDSQPFGNEGYSLINETTGQCYVESIGDSQYFNYLPNPRSHLLYYQSFNNSIAILGGPFSGNIRFNTWAYGANGNDTYWLRGFVVRNSPTGTWNKIICGGGFKDLKKN